MIPELETPLKMQPAGDIPGWLFFLCQLIAYCFANVPSNCPLAVIMRKRYMPPGS